MSQIQCPYSEIMWVVTFKGSLQFSACNISTGIYADIESADDNAISPSNAHTIVSLDATCSYFMY